MATVSLLDAFTYKWAQTGTAEALTDDQWKVGWAFIGATPPSVEQFNRWGQVYDEKSNYLYGQMKAVFDQAGQTPGALDSNTLRNSLSAIFGGKLAVLTASGNFIVPAGVYALDVEVYGAGGGSGGVGSTSNGSAGGGGGGGYARSIVAVTPGQSISYTIGAAGSAGAAGAPGGVGGTTSFGTLSATGGAGGSANGSGTGGTGGVGTGGTINASGGGGSGGLTAGLVGPGAQGGSASYGGAGGGGGIGIGAAGAIPGGGAGGTGSSLVQAGSAGGRGQVNIRY